jgi:hypothetical protein
VDIDIVPGRSNIAQPVTAKNPEHKANSSAMARAPLGTVLSSLMTNIVLNSINAGR